MVITSGDPNPPPPDYGAATAGGVFYDTMIHDFDLEVWLLGERPISYAPPQVEELDDFSSSAKMLEEFEVSESKFVSKIF